MSGTLSEKVLDVSIIGGMPLCVSLPAGGFRQVLTRAQCFEGWCEESWESGIGMYVESARMLSWRGSWSVSRRRDGWTDATPVLLLRSVIWVSFGIFCITLPFKAF